ncbi:MAG: thioredoxin [Xanthobacteraceae bacterium]|nr:MAG: thioredoxin [Xanthobacteraceae bacterium]
MQIVCPHCHTSYGVDAAALGPTGRQVRCTRCREVWHARPEAAAQMATAGAAPHFDPPAQDDWTTDASRDSWPEAAGAPRIDSPSIAGGFDDLPGDADTGDDAPGRRDTRSFGRRGTASRGLPEWLRRPGPGLMRRPVSLNVAILAMAALTVGLLIWRAEVVRALPQTASFFKMIGFGVNLRGLDFTDVRVTAETVDGAPVLVIEGAIVGLARKPLEIPRLRFVVRDVRGNDIYAWNTVLEQSRINPGEKVPFRSRLAAPPAEAHDIAVRFFHRRDLAGGDA